MARHRSVRLGFDQRFLRSLRLAGIGRHDRLTVGFSGGADSLALACALTRVRKPLEIDVQLVHVDHRLRPGSVGDGATCQSIAGELGLPIQLVRLEDGLRDRSGGLGLEEAARRERYLALAGAATQWRSSTLLLGHQANDQAETVLLHLFRGSGSKGLAGMSLLEERLVPWWTTSGRPELRFRIVRPLLSESRTVIENYVAELGFSPIDDESNATADFDRNWLRHRVLPEILERWPAAIESIDRMAEIVRSDITLIDERFERLGTAIGGDDRTLCTDKLMSVPEPIARRAIKQWLTSLGIENVSHDVVARSYELAQSRSEEREIEIGNARSLVVSEGSLILLDDLARTAGRSFPLVDSTGRGSWVLSIDPGDEMADGVALAPLGSRLEVRALRRGDRWFGTKRSVFEDLRHAGIHPQLRMRVLAVATDGGVLLIPAIYPTIRARVMGEQTRNVGVRWRKAEG